MLKGGGGAGGHSSWASSLWTHTHTYAGFLHPHMSTYNKWKKGIAANSFNALGCIGNTRCCRPYFNKSEAARRLSRLLSSQLKPPFSSNTPPESVSVFWRINTDRQRRGHADVELIAGTGASNFHVNSKSATSAGSGDKLALEREREKLHSPSKMNKKREKGVRVTFFPSPLVKCDTSS